MPFEEAGSRLRLQPYQAEQLRSLFRFMRDPVAMSFTYVAPTMEACGVRLARFEAQRARLGFAPWCVFLQGGDEPIGWGGLAVDPEAPQWGIEVIYAFAPEHWGRGHATELVRLSLRFAFDVIGVAEVSAFARPDHLASRRVLEKCGFSSRGAVAALDRIHYAAVKTCRLSSPNSISARTS